MIETLQKLVADTRFREEYARLKQITLSEERHSSANAYEHSELVRRHAVALAQVNNRSPDDLVILDALGMAHDMGKAGDRSQHAEESMRIVQEHGVNDAVFLALIRFHDIALSWHKSHLKGEAPSDKAWRRLAAKVDMTLFCIFMAADRADKTGGWRANEPVVWFFDEALRRGLVPKETIFDIPDDSANQASEVTARKLAEPQG
jgi:hypothetical protein